MKRKKNLEIIQAALSGDKDRVVYLLQHVKDPDVVCYFLRPDGSAKCGGKVLTADELNREIAMAKKYGTECIEVDFAKAM